jgi:negative regulator of genetic competence, sporulation and motility
MCIDGSVASVKVQYLRTVQKWVMMFKGHCCPKSVILQAVYFKLRFTLSYRDVEELMQMRGVNVDHATVQRWVFKFSTLIEDSFQQEAKLLEDAGGLTVQIHQRQRTMDVFVLSSRQGRSHCWFSSDQAKEQRFCAEIPEQSYWQQW